MALGTAVTVALGAEERSIAAVAERLTLVLKKENWVDTLKNTVMN